MSKIILYIVVIWVYRYILYIKIKLNIKINSVIWYFKGIFEEDCFLLNSVQEKKLFIVFYFNLILIFFIYYNNLCIYRYCICNFYQFIENFQYILNENN